MPKAFSFIHAADLHLGSPFKGAGSKVPASAALLRSATYEAFSRLISLCLEQKPAFLLVAGDVFDQSGRSIQAQLTFRDGLARLSDAGIETFVVTGNHDPWEAWSRRMQWPERAHRFSSHHAETRVAHAAGTPVAAITGISYRTRREARNLSGLLRPDGSELYQIALLHANCGGHPGHDTYAPCTVTDLQARGFDYWALGHIHEAVCMATAPHIVYPGCTQGLSIRESGPHGCWLASVASDGRTELAFHSLDVARWQTAAVSIDGMEGLEQLDAAIGMGLEKVRAKGQDRPVIARLTVTGRGPLYEVLRQPGAKTELADRARQLGEAFSPPVWVQDLAVDCRPGMDLAARRKADDLAAQILDTADTLAAEGVSSSDGLLPALRVLYGHPRIGRLLRKPDADEQAAMIASAALLCLDLLEGAP